jgi:hypothetical protein
MIPVKFIEPEIFIDPVNVIVSTFAENTVVPAAPEINVEPVTINDPEIIAEPVYGNDDAAAALSAYDAVAAYDELATLLTVTGNVVAFPFVNVIVALLIDAVVINDPVSIVVPALSAYDAVTAKLEEILYKEPVCNCPGLNCLAIMPTSL